MSAINNNVLRSLDWRDFLKEILPQWPIVENPKDGTLLVHIPEGDFLAGDKKHPVRLPGYYLAIHSVTNAQFAQFLNEKQSSSGTMGEWIHLGKSHGISKSGTSYVAVNGYEHHPVRGCSYFGALDYCEWAGLSLPHELEWEKGARGLDGREFPWGNEWNPTRCRSNIRQFKKGTCSVWDYPAGTSPFGIYQMSGNVAEWTSSSYFWGAWELYKEGKLNGNTARGPCEVLRGGSYSDDNAPSFCCVSRIGRNPLFGYEDTGFRCCARNHKLQVRTCQFRGERAFK